MDSRSPDRSVASPCDLCSLPGDVPARRVADCGKKAWQSGPECLNELEVNQTPHSGMANMNCSLSTVNALIWGAIAALLAAMALAFFWVAALPLFAAAALVASVSFYFIPHIKQALLDYATCRGPGNCTISEGVNTLGQAAAMLSLVAFALAGAMEITALGFIFSWFLSWLGMAMQAAVLALVHTGLVSCAIVILILIGVLTNAYAYKKCMDKQDGGSGPVSPPTTIE